MNCPNPVCLRKRLDKFRLTLGCKKKTIHDLFTMDHFLPPQPYFYNEPLFGKIILVKAGPFKLLNVVNNELLII